MKDMPVPQASRRKCCSRSGDQLIRWSIFSGTHAAAILLAFYLEMPIRRAVCCAMMIAAEAEGQHSQFYGTIFLTQHTMYYILNISSILPIFHPDAFLKSQIFIQAIEKTWNIGFQCDRFEINIAVGIKYTAWILSGTKFK